MKLTVPQLKKQFNTGADCGFYLFYGDEGYLIERYTDTLRSLTVTAMPEFNYLAMTEDNCDFEGFFSFASSFPVMSERKMAVLKNTDFLRDRRYTDKLLSLINSSEGYATVLFIEPSLVKMNKDILTAIENKGIVTEFPRQTPADLRAWVNKTFAAAGKRMKIDDMELLVNMCCRSLEKLDTECKKLIAAAPDDVITRETITKMVLVPTEYKVFSMSDCLLNKKADEAYALLREFKINKESATEIIGLIYATLSDINMFRLLSREGASGEKYLPQNRKWLARKYSGMANRIKGKSLRAAMKLCADCDLKIKTGEMNDYAALELVMAKILVDF